MYFDPRKESKFYIIKGGFYILFGIYFLIFGRRFIKTSGIILSILFGLVVGIIIYELVNIPIFSEPTHVWPIFILPILFFTISIFIHSFIFIMLCGTISSVVLHFLWVFIGDRIHFIKFIIILGSIVLAIILRVFFESQVLIIILTSILGSLFFNFGLFHLIYFKKLAHIHETLSTSAGWQLIWLPIGIILIAALSIFFQLYAFKRRFKDLERQESFLMSNYFLFVKNEKETNVESTQF